MARPIRHIPNLEEFRTQLHRHKLRTTRQRLAVHEVMMELEHASAEDVRGALEERGTSLPTATVYNILSQLADCRIYGRRMSSGSKMYFDIMSSRHLHLYDRENHVYRNLEDEQLNVLVAEQMKHRKFRGYTIEDIDIQIIVRPSRRKKKV